MAESGAQVFRHFLERSLQLLARDAPEHFVAVRRRMRGLAVCIGIDGSAPVRVQLDVEPWVGPPAHAEVLAEIGHADLAAVLDGKLTIEEALDDDRLLLRGELDHLLQFLDALSAWIHGAVRCAATVELYHDYLVRMHVSRALAAPQFASRAKSSARA